MTVANKKRPEAAHRKWVRIEFYMYYGMTKYQTKLIERTDKKI